MNATRIGLIREGKVPIDRRVPLTPEQAKHLMAEYPNLTVVAQRSEVRAYSDTEYEKAGITLVDDVSDCDIILGVKEVPINSLVPGKTHIFFSHTIKKQPYNRELLQAILEKGIQLIDYETLTDQQGNRLVAFGRYAGIVGAYNGLIAYGKKHKMYNLRPAHTLFDMAEMEEEYKKIALPPIKIVITGGGRVAKGAMEVLDGAGIKKVEPEEILNKNYNIPVYAQLNSKHYHVRKDGGKFVSAEFYKDPAQFNGDFLKYAQAAQMLIACAYWNPQAPVLFTVEEMKNPEFTLNVIADITCDIEGSIPSTKRPSTIDSPVYDYLPEQDQEAPAYSSENAVSVMAVDNLPCELPRNASVDFGTDLINNILPSLLKEDNTGIIKRATITQEGQLTTEYKYLQGYVEGKE